MRQTIKAFSKYDKLKFVVFCEITLIIIAKNNRYKVISLKFASNSSPIQSYQFTDLNLNL